MCVEAAAALLQLLTDQWLSALPAELQSDLSSRISARLAATDTFHGAVVWTLA